MDKYAAIKEALDKLLGTNFQLSNNSQNESLNNGLNISLLKSVIGQVNGILQLELNKNINQENLLNDIETISLEDSSRALSETKSMIEKLSNSTDKKEELEELKAIVVELEAKIELNKENLLNQRKDMEKENGIEGVN